MKEESPRRAKGVAQRILLPGSAVVCICAAAMALYAALQVGSLRARLAHQGATLDELRQAETRQTALMHRALGTAIPVTLPAETAGRLEQLEAEVAKHRKSRPTTQEAQRLRSKLEEIMKAMRPWEQEEALPRLTLLRWEVEVLCAWGRATAAEGEALAQVVDEHRTLVDVAPSNADPDVRRALEQRSATLEQRLQAYLRQDAVRQAEAMLNQSPEERTAEELRAALNRLEEYGGEEVAELKGKVRGRYVLQRVRDRVASIRQRVRLFADLETRAFEAEALGRAYQASMDLLVWTVSAKGAPGEAMAAAKETAQEVRNRLEKLATDEREAQNEAAKARTRRYQAYALKQIERFQTFYYDAAKASIREMFQAFEEPKGEVEWPLLRVSRRAREFLEARTGVDLPADGRLTVEVQKRLHEQVRGWFDLDLTMKYVNGVAYRVSRDAMVKYLLPVDSALLAPAVSKLYWRWWEKGWEKLEDEGRLYVAEQEAKVPKNGLDDIPEE
ncbi:MAG: hypothetical protein ACODAJ_03390 [Planctomycetota bacterium]